MTFRNSYARKRMRERENEPGKREKRREPLRREERGGGERESARSDGFPRAGSQFSSSAEGSEREVEREREREERAPIVRIRQSIVFLLISALVLKKNEGESEK